MHIRPSTSADFARLHAINQASTPGVGAVSEGELASLIGMSDLTVLAEHDGNVSGFILCLTEGTTYQSPNYLWCVVRYACFAYCDRIAVAPEARGRGLGEQLYAAAFEHFAGRRAVLLCEVNLAPPNPGSLKFHERLGFRAVGEAWSDDRSKGVVYLEKRLT
ncbi:MAG: GNAT family N-acetyltransferase [Hyphomicrobiaceae bacterium]